MIIKNAALTKALIILTLLSLVFKNMTDFVHKEVYLNTPVINADRDALYKTAEASARSP